MAIPRLRDEEVQVPTVGMVWCFQGIERRPMGLVNEV